MKNSPFLFLIILIPCIVLFIYQMGEIISPGQNEKYTIRSNNMVYMTNKIIEYGDCVFFDDNKICGNYIIEIK